MRSGWEWHVQVLRSRHVRRAKPSKVIEDAFFAANEAFEGLEAPFEGETLEKM